MIWGHSLVGRTSPSRNGRLAFSEEISVKEVDWKDFERHMFDKYSNVRTARDYPFNIHANYFNPALISDLKERIFKAIEEIQILIFY